jgi:hypothetical protein
MSNILRGTRRVAMTAGAMALSAAALFGTAHAAAASTAGHRGILLPGNPTRGRDPAVGRVARSLPGGGRTVYVGATWSGGWVNPLGADYAWMYDDGPGGSNLDCRGGSAKLCWGHRDILLASSGLKYCHGRGELAMGTGHAGRAGGYGESDTVLMAGVCGHVPADATFTWAKAKTLLHIR